MNIVAFFPPDLFARLRRCNLSGQDDNVQLFCIDGDPAKKLMVYVSAGLVFEADTVYQVAFEKRQANAATVPFHHLCIMVGPNHSSVSDAFRINYLEFGNEEYLVFLGDRIEPKFFLKTREGNAVVYYTASNQRCEVEKLAFITVTPFTGLARIACRLSNGKSMPGCIQYPMGSFIVYDHRQDRTLNVAHVTHECLQTTDGKVRRVWFRLSDILDPNARDKKLQSVEWRLTSEGLKPINDS